MFSFLDSVIRPITKVESLAGDGYGGITYLSVLEDVQRVKASVPYKDTSIKNMSSRLVKNYKSDYSFPKPASSQSIIPRGQVFYSTVQDLPNRYRRTTAIGKF